MTDGTEPRSRPVHVLEIIGNSIVGGMESYVARVVSSLPANQFKFTCLCPFESRFTAHLRDAGCDVYITPLYNDPPWHSVQMAAQLVERLNINVIHCHLPNAHVVAGLASQLTQTPALATVHGMHISMLELEAHKLTGTSLAVVSHAAYTHALAIGVSADRLHMITNGVDTEQFTPDGCGDALRAELAISRQARVVGFVGRLSPEKYPEMFMRTAWLTHQIDPNAHFVLIGEGPLKGDLEKMARHFGLTDRVHLPGCRKATRDVYAAFDVLALTSRHEGTPLVLFEAMACGLPVVATDVGGVPEIVENRSTGFMVGVDDYATMAALVGDLIAQPKLARAMGAAGRKRVEDQFQLKNGLDMLSKLLRRLAFPPHRRSGAVVDLVPPLEEARNRDESTGG